MAEEVAQAQGGGMHGAGHLHAVSSAICFSKTGLVVMVGQANVAA